VPTRAARAADPTTHGTPRTVTQGYGQRERRVESVAETAVWYHTGLPPVAIRWVRIRDPDERFAAQAVRCTELTVAPAQVIAWFVRRWQMETTFAEVRRPRGVETQRQWTERAIRRTTPILRGRFALVTPRAHPHLREESDLIRQAAGYRKRAPTFADALALARRQIWRHEGFCTSDAEADTIKVPRAFLEHLTETLCSVA
jgi:hypothetical protein